jgi:hypothetical protein
MAHEVSALMGATDEEEWEREGLFSIVDELCMSKGGGCKLNDLTIPSVKALLSPSHCLSKVLTLSYPGASEVLLQNHSALGQSKGLSQRVLVEGIDTIADKFGSGIQMVHT